MEAVAGLVGLGDAGEGSSIAALGDAPQQLGVELAADAGAVVVGADIDAGFG